MKRMSRIAASIVLAGLAAEASGAAHDPLSCMRGINLSGAEFGEIGGAYGAAYIYPSKETIDYFVTHGMNTVRLPFKWERLQPVPGARLDDAELERLKTSVDMLAKRGLIVILDPHNYAVYADKQIGSKDFPDYLFADFWARLAVEFADRKDVVFGLMNEPHDIGADVWLKAANGAIQAIRSVNAPNLVLVPGTDWTGAHSWMAKGPNGTNGEVLLGIKDTADNYAYEVHQYLDEDFSGTKEACVKSREAVEAIAAFTGWLRTNGKRGFLGEFGAAGNAACLKGLQGMVKTIADNGDVWIGWTYWVAGDWWPPTEAMNVQPVSGKDRPQMKALKSACPKNG